MIFLPVIFLTKNRAEGANFFFLGQKLHIQENSNKKTHADRDERTVLGPER